MPEYPGPMLKKFLAMFRPAPTEQLAASSQTATKLAERLIAEGRRAEDEGRLSEACECYRKAIGTAPEHAAAHLNLGVGLAAMGDADGAKQAYHSALALEPDNAYANYNLANLSYSEGDFAEAERLLRLALTTKPEFPEAHVALSNVLDLLDRAEDALDELAIALQLNPDYLGALHNYCRLAIKWRRYEDAEDAARHLLELDPENPDALQFLAIALWGQGRCAESLERFRALRVRVPWSMELESKELFLLNYDETLSAEEVYQRHREYGARLEQANPARFASFSGNPDPESRLRIGYVSADYNWHPVALFLLPVVERHHRESCEVFCYYTGNKVDEVTRTLRPLPDHWIEAAEMSDTELADAIHRDGIDILVDLAGHTASSRLSVFAKQPAPVQVSWMGYLNTTGLTRIHYRLCDQRTDPVGISDPLHTETLVRLPHSQWCYRPFIIMDTAEQAPCEKNGFITFGSFNSSMKVSPAVCALWAEILSQVPHSQLLCFGVNSSRKMAELLSELTLTGVDAERIRIVARTSLNQYFAWFNEVDIALDTFPYGGGTTTFDALWMGVPVVAATGSTPTSRSAASILSALELDAWIAPTLEDYVRVGVERAADQAVIAELRRSLRPALQASPLMDEVRFVRDLEEAYRRMWRDWCAKSG